MSVTRGMPDLVIGVSHYWKSLESDLLRIPTGAAVSSLSHYLSSHSLFCSLLVE